MFKQLLRDVRKQPIAPYAVLAVVGVGVAGAVTYAVARSRSDGGSLSVASGKLTRELGRLGRQGAGVLEEGGDRLRDAMPSSSDLSSTVAASGQHARQMASSAGLSEKAIATFLATFLAKSVFSYLRWGSEKSARQQGEALASDTGEDFDSQLEDHTVKELRGMAAEQDIEGRSSMNKDELIDALSDPD